MRRCVSLMRPMITPREMNRLMLDVYIECHYMGAILTIYKSFPYDYIISVYKREAQLEIINIHCGLLDELILFSPLVSSFALTK